jgi:signal transduction histidine kinase
MSTQLEYRTLFFASGLVGGALSMLLVIQVHKLFPGIARITVGLNMLAVTIVIGGIRGYVPDALWIVEFAALGAFALMDNGIRLHCAMPRRGVWPSTYVLGSMFLITYLYLTRPLHSRIVVTSLLSIPIFIDSTLPLLKTPPRGCRFGYRLTAILFMLYSVTAFVRIVAVWFSRGNDSPYFAPGHANTAFFLLVLFLLSASAFALAVLTYEKLVADLTTTHEELIVQGREKERVAYQLGKAERIATVGRLAGGVAHFLNNQLQIIQFAWSLLQQSLSALDNGLPFVKDIEKAGKRSSEIAGRLLQFAQSKIVRTSQINLKLLLEEITPELRAEAGERIEIATSCTSEVPTVEVDVDLLKETLLTLIRNAREAMLGRGAVKISLCERELDPALAWQLQLSPGTFVLLTVVDTGPGMDDDTLRHVFEPFFTTKSIANAEGLGLASAFGFVRQSGGTITVRSTLAQGSAFELYFPTPQGVPVVA